MMRIGLYVLIVSVTMFFLSSVYVRALSGSTQELLAQAEEALDFEDWYEPDEAYQTDDEEKPDEGEVIPEGGDNEPRVAPDEDTRPKDR